MRNPAADASVQPAYFAAPVAAYFCKRALRRRAALRWMTPLFAARSMAEIRSRILSGSVLSPAPAPFCKVRRRLRALRLRSDRFKVCRARFAADLVFAIFRVGGRARSWPEPTLSRSTHGTLWPAANRYARGTLRAATITLREPVAVLCAPADLTQSSASGAGASARILASDFETLGTFGNRSLTMCTTAPTCS